MNETREPKLYSGEIQIGGASSPGCVMLTASTVFMLRYPKPEPSLVMGSLFGLIGGLLGWLFSFIGANREARKHPPAHMRNPEIARLGNRLKAKLALMELMCAMAINPDLEVRIECQCVRRSRKRI